MSKLNEIIEYLDSQQTISEPTPSYTENNNRIESYIEFLKKLDKPQLNNNQQVVLEWLKKEFNAGEDVLGVLFTLFNEWEGAVKKETEEVYHSFSELNKFKQLEVFQAFAEFGLRGEAE